MEQINKQHLLFPLVSGVFLGIAISFMISDSAFGIGIGQCAIIGMISALTSFFLQFCYRPGNIFGRYMDWLDRNFRDNPKNPFGTLYNPLGGCSYCQNVYVVAFIFFMAYLIVGLSWWLLVPSIVIGHFFLTLLDILFWQ